MFNWQKCRKLGILILVGGRDIGYFPSSPLLRLELEIETKQLDLILGAVILSFKVELRLEKQIKVLGFSNCLEIDSVAQETQDKLHTMSGGNSSAVFYVK